MGDCARLGCEYELIFLANIKQIYSKISARAEQKRFPYFLVLFQTNFLHSIKTIIGAENELSDFFMHLSVFIIHVKR